MFLETNTWALKWYICSLLSVVTKIISLDFSVLFNHQELFKWTAKQLKLVLGCQAVTFFPGYCHMPFFYLALIPPPLPAVIIFGYEKYWCKQHIVHPGCVNNDDIDTAALPVNASPLPVWPREKNSWPFVSVVVNWDDTYLLVVFCSFVSVST